MNSSKYALSDLVWACGAAAALALAGCGGGSSSSDSGGTDPTTPTTPTSPTAYVLDAVVLPASAVKSVAATAQSLGASVKTTYIALPEVDTTKIEEAAFTKAARQIGTPRAVAATGSVAKTQQALQWQTLADGRQAAAINIASGGAYGLRAGVLVDQLPDSASLRVYSQERPDAIVETSGVQVNALLAQNAKAGETGAAAATWWTPEVGAGNATLEVVLPAGVSTDALRIAIPTISHVFQNLALPTEEELVASTKATGVGAAGGCNLDTSCTTNYQTERNAVARMLFTESDGKSYLCTGTLVNNTKQDYKPFFITANHCISTQSVASSLQTNWFFRSSSCNSGVAGSSITRTGGATLLYATSTTDSSFLQLNEMPPAGVTLAGWDARSQVQTSTAIYGLHHPSGDLLKYSVGSVTGYYNCASSGGVSVSCTTGDAGSNFYRVVWAQGVTETGSSGSSLFTNGRVVGTLFGGSSMCTASGAPDTYGRFDKVFSSKIWNWLAG